MRLTVSLIILSLILVACGGEAEPTPSVFSDPTVDPSQITPEPTSDESEIYGTEEVSVSVLVTPQANVEQGEVPLPGTLAFDPDASMENFNEMFDRIVFRRYGGGSTAGEFRLELSQDGSYEINNTLTGQVAASVVTNVDTLIRDVNFFAINTPMLGPGGDDTNYRYDITVERAGDVLTIRAEDGFIPQPFQRLIAALVGVYASIPQ